MAAFAGTAALWWLYFDYVARIAERRLELSPQRTRLARDAGTYLHVVMVAGVIGAAVGGAVIAAEPASGKRRESRGEPSPMERLQAAPGGAGAAGADPVP